MRQEIQQALRNKYAGVSISVEKERAGPPVGYPVNIEISGDYDELIEVAENLKGFLNNESLPGVEEIKVNVNKSKPGLLIAIDRRKSGAWASLLDKLGSNCGVLFLRKAGIYKRWRVLLHQCARFDKDSRNDTGVLLDQYIVFRDQATGRIL